MYIQYEYTVCIYSMNIQYVYTVCTVHIRCNLRGKLVLNAYAILANAYQFQRTRMHFWQTRALYKHAHACACLYNARVILNPCNINAYTRVNAYAYACGFNYERV